MPPLPPPVNPWAAVAAAAAVEASSSPEDAALPVEPETAPDLEATLTAALLRMNDILRTPGTTAGAIRSATSTVLDLEKRQRLRALEDSAASARYDFERLTTEELEAYEALRRKALL